MTDKLQETIFTLRTDFASGEFNEKIAGKNPFRLFEQWMQNALESEVNEPNAMTLATSSKSGQPDARIVLLRNFDKNGFVFFTNYKSEKGKEMDANKKVCLNFFWTELHRQVRILGSVEKLSAKASEEYFRSRPRESQIGAWASNQSEAIESRAALESRYVDIELKYHGKDVPRPPHWGGVRVKPVHIEFWQGRPNRLHDRIVFKKMRDGKWKTGRINP
jgi:pyridoxamine 5'-phosphate oxidase